MSRVVQKGSFATWQEALDEALRLQHVCVTKFGPAENNWRYQVRKRREGRHDRWRIFTPASALPRRRVP